MYFQCANKAQSTFFVPIFKMDLETASETTQMSKWSLENIKMPSESLFRHY